MTVTSSEGDGLPGTAAVIGLGLIGGSVARELASRGTAVLVHDSRPEVIESALRSEPRFSALRIDSVTISRAELVVIATPVDAALETLGSISPYLHSGAVVTDVGSVKRPIEERALSLGIAERFVGSHPMAGDHRSGWQASRLGLFAGTTVFTCATPETRASASLRVAAFWHALGATQRPVSAAEHDRLVGWVSHLPQVTASAVAAVIGAAQLAPSELGAGGRDVTRLAGSSTEMWTAIALANADNLSESVTAMERRLASFTDALGSRDVARIREYFESGRRWLEGSTAPENR